MEWSDPFLLGPLGSMQALPSPPVEQGVDADYQRTDAVHTSLTGAATLDVMGAHRQWKFTWAYRRRSETTTVIAHYTRPGTRALRMLDPLTPNLLSLSASAPDRASADTDVFTVDTGALSFTDVDDLPDGLVLPRAATWDRDRGETGLLLVDNDSPAPVVEQHITGSMYVRGTGWASPVLRETDRDGAKKADHQGEAVMLGADWIRLSISRPLADATGCLFGLLVEDDTSGGDSSSDAVDNSIDVTGLQLEYGDAPTEWSPGGGCPEVILTELTQKYTELGTRRVKLTVQEA